MGNRKISSDISLLLQKDEQTYLDSRITDIEKAASRGRWIYGAIYVLSMMLISVAYNEYFSWSRLMASNLEGIVDRAWESQLKLMLMREWVSSLQFDVPYVGGKFGASDAGIVGGFVLLLASFWCYYAVGRENFLIFYLIKDAEEFKFSENAKFYLRNQIVSTQLFSESSPKAYDSDSLREFATISLADHLYAADRSVKPATTAQKEASRLSRARRLRELMMHVIFLMPVISLIFVFMTDVLTLREASPFRPSGSATLYVLLCGENFIWKCDTPQLPVRLIGSILFILFVSRMMFLSLRFQKGTDRLVRFVLENWRQPLTDLREEAKNR